MRRDDRAVENIEEIYDILTRCDTIHLAMKAGDYPYVIPMTFGLRMEEGRIVLYFHCAGEGRKMELLKADPKVCVEGALYYQVKKTPEGGITARYESVIGTGEAEWLSDTKSKVDAMKVMLEHYRESGFPVTSCKGLDRCEVFRVVLQEVSGKHNL